MPGDPRFSSTYDGRVYHFVNADAKQEFDRNPDKYVPAYGGLCAFGMSIDKEFEACPTSFRIIDGRLHLFLKNDDTDALELWNKEDEAKCLANANRHWSARNSA
jgi:YHS domain-containing protein